MLAKLIGHVKRPVDIFNDLIDPGTSNSAEFGYEAGDVRIYNRALNPEEVRRLYNMGR